MRDRDESVRSSERVSECLKERESARESRRKRERAIEIERSMNEERLNTVKGECGKPESTLREVSPQRES